MNSFLRMVNQLNVVRLSTVGAMIVLGACSMVNDHPQDYAAVYPDESADARPATGSIYQANRDVALFENPIAGRVGDILTIHLVESTTASKKSSTNTKKATNASIGVSNIFGRAPTIRGTNPLSAGMDDSSGFTGEGNSAQSNTLAGDITVTVAKRYSNGNLLIRGQKWLQLNQGQEYVRIQGLVRQADIQPDNTIASTKVANATISYGGQGALADANAKGWLSRFFDSPLTPF